MSNHAHFFENVASKSVMTRERIHGTAAESWSKPMQGVYKLNVDGSHCVTRGESACGGLIRNSSGLFIKGFFCKVTTSNIVWAEM